MVKDPQTISRLLFERGPWDAIDSDFERRLPFDSPADFRDLLQRKIDSGAAKLWHLRETETGPRIGFVITEIDEGAARELVICAAVCEGSAPFSREIARTAEAIAAAEGCVSIRFHTIRPAAARLAADEFGYRLTELVLRKNV